LLKFDIVIDNEHDVVVSFTDGVGADINVFSTPKRFEASEFEFGSGLVWSGVVWSGVVWSGHQRFQIHLL
jgi:hypothetical protein